VVERWTRNEEVYILDGLDNALTVTATFESWEYRQAYIDRYAYDFRLTDPERQALESEQRGELESAHVFLVAATSTKMQWSDFTAVDTPWKIRLVNDQATCSPPSPRPRAARDRDDAQGDARASNCTSLHPTSSATCSSCASAHDAGRRAVPARPGVEAFTLEFTGALGRAELRWSSAAE